MHFYYIGTLLCMVSWCMVLSTQLGFPPVYGSHYRTDVLELELPCFAGVLGQGLVASLLIVEEPADLHEAYLEVIVVLGDLAHHILVPLISSSPPVTISPVTISPLSSVTMSLVLSAYRWSSGSLVSTALLSAVNSAVSSIRAEKVSPRWRNGGASPFHQGVNSDVQSNLELRGRLSVHVICIVCKDSIEETVENSQRILACGPEELVSGCNLNHLYNYYV